MITLSRWRSVLAAACAGLALLSGGGCSSGHRSPAAALSTRALGAPGGPDGVPGADSAGPTAMPGTWPPAAPSSGQPEAPGGSGGTAGLDPPVGWRLSDLPTFPPAPAPEPIILPGGDAVPYLSRLPVTQPVAFLTIDDGYLKPAEGPKLFAAAHVPVTLFLTTDAIRDDVAYFDRLRSYGAVIEAHTISHRELRGQPSAVQRHEICDGADRLGRWYGRRPVLFRPPFGDRDRTTLQVAHGCGIRAAFMWRETVHKGVVRFQEGNTIQRGDIILMHFRPAFVQDFLAALRAIHRAGLTPALLEDYIPDRVAAPTEPRHTRPAHTFG